VQDLLARAAQQVAHTRVLRFMELTPSGLSALETATPPSIEWRSLTPDELLRAAADQRHDLDEAFVDDAMARGDECFGFVREGELVYYEFFSTKPTAIDESLWVQVQVGTVYAYKAFTLPSHRGRHLHADAATHAMRLFAARGALAMVSYIASNNFASIRAHIRAGFRQIGTALIITPKSESGAGPVVRMSAGCRERGIFITDRPGPLD
jgi:RimJ/RimL family protein N-acetyltransferase